MRTVEDVIVRLTGEELRREIPWQEIQFRADYFDIVSRTGDTSEGLQHARIQNCDTLNLAVHEGKLLPATFVHTIAEVLVHFDDATFDRAVKEYEVRNPLTRVDMEGYLQWITTVLEAA